MNTKKLNLNFASDDAVWTAAGLSLVRWLPQRGINVPVLFVKTPKGVKVAGLKPSSLRWWNQSVFATFTDGEGFEVRINTRFYDGLKEFGAQLKRELEQRQAA